MTAPSPHGTRRDAAPTRIRVCYTVDSAYAGGAERYVALILDALDRERFEPSVVAAAREGLDAWCAEIASRGVEVSRARMNLPFRPLHAVGVVRTLRAQAPHVVHVNMPGPYDGQMALLAPLARLAGASAVVATEHLPMVARLWKRAAVKRIAEHWVDRVISITHANVAYLVERQGIDARKIRVVHNGLPAGFGRRRDERREPARARLGIPPDSVAIAMIGSLIERKGVSALLEAAAALRSRGWRLFIVGSGPDRSRFVDQAGALGLGERVRFTGSLGAADVEELLCAMDLLVVPSFMEGLPYVILEAMACSLPVVATAIYGVPEAAVHGETALLVEPGDAAALAAAIDTLVGDAALRAAMGAKGRARFEAMFTLDRHIAAVESVYRNVLLGDADTRGEAVG